MNRSWMTRGATRAAGVVVLCAVLTTGCLSGGSCGSASSRAGALGRSVRAMIGASTASASCAEAVEFRHRLYVAWSRDLPVAKGRLLGDAVYPPCNDGGGCSPGDPDTAHPTEVWAMRGVDPHQVVIGRAQGTGELAVFGRLHAHPHSYFRFTGGTWHLRDEAGRTTGSR